jgi:predicted RNase H-like nuclease (RuvC/YqgF family)
VVTNDVKTAEASTEETRPEEQSTVASFPTAVNDQITDSVTQVSTDVDMIRLYEEDNQALYLRVSELQNEIVGLKREIEKLNKEVSNKSADKTKRVLVALKTLVETGVISTDEAFDKLAKVI